ncbi:MAG TPA: HlyD family efflux transporter periplasmic adaptor subunit [Roseiflexaceae bacterium]|nr:HlyD family efflux transporter periplasmic adaptor subunit [Roseiflexaceae bacterium]
MKQTYKLVVSATLAGLLALALAACGTEATMGASAAQPQQASAVAQPATIAEADTLGTSIIAIGEVKPTQDANLTFQVAGTVAQVLVKEGDLVKKDQLLAVLDTRAFDEKVSQAQAALQVAQAALQSAQAQKQIALAAQSALTDPPKPAMVSAARAQVRAAMVALKQARTGQNQNVISAQAGVTAAQDSLQSTNDKLSRAKTSADAAVEQAALALTQAQAAYATAKSNWDYVQETDKNPANPNTVNPLTGKKTANKVTDAQRAQYYTTYVQAEAAMHQAELKVQQAQIDAQQARQAEITGIQAAEQQLTQARSALDKVAVPADQDSVAAAQANLSLAQANLANLQPDPRPADKAKAAANVSAADASIAAAEATVAQAQAALAQAQLSRAYAEIHAPYAGQIAQVNVDPFDASTTVGQPAIRLLDLSTLRVEVPISDVDSARVQLGRAAQLHTDARDQVFTGRVSYIAPEATASGSTRTYLVRIDLDPRTDLRPGMQVTVAIAAT